MKNRGYVTVEAAIVMPIFVVFIIVLISIIKIFYIKEYINNALYESVIDFSQDMYIYNKVSNDEDIKEIVNSFKDTFKIDSDDTFDFIVKEINSESLLYFYKQKFLKYIQKDNRDINNIINNIDFSKSNISNNDINIEINYLIDTHLFIDKYKYINVKESLYVKPCSMGIKNINDIKISYYYMYYDVWKKDKLIRGKEIGNYFGNNLGYKFYGIDKLDNRRLESIVSIDITKKTYNTDENLYNRIKYKIDQLYNFKNGIKNGVTVLNTQYDYKKMTVVIPDEKISDRQNQMLEKAKIYCDNKNITFNIIILGVKKGV